MGTRTHPNPLPLTEGEGATESNCKPRHAMLEASQMSRPRVTLKLATSLDGRIATAAGESRWITGPAARAEVQRMRAEHDAVMVGGGTVRADDPELLARTEPPPAAQPARVVLSKAFDIPVGGRLFQSLDRAPVIVLGGEVGPNATALLRAGAKVGMVASEGPGVDLLPALELLEREWRIGSILCEGGGQLAASLIAAGAVDRLEWFRAPIMLGGEGRPAVAALALSRLSDAPKWRRVAIRELGPDIWESYERA